MFPIAAIGGVIGAAISIAKGVSWLSDQLETARSSASAGGKVELPGMSEAKGAQFEAALAAQVAGQKQPLATPTVPEGPLLPRGPDYATADRIKAGVLAYGQIGDRHVERSTTQARGDQPMVRG